MTLDRSKAHSLQEIIDTLDLSVLTAPKDFSQVVPTSGYASDLLSCVMAGAKNNGLWITLQAHINIVAVAALLDLAAILITEGAQPDEAVIRKANEQGVILLSTKLPTYTVIGKLWESSLKNLEF
jgi:predicted transcriptional regulator